MKENNELKKERIVKAVKNIKKMEMEDECAGLFGYSIITTFEEESCNSYEDISNDLLNLYDEYPEQTELIDKFVIAVCGSNTESILDKMKEKKEVYIAL